MRTMFKLICAFGMAAMISLVACAQSENPSNNQQMPPAIKPNTDTGSNSSQKSEYSEAEKSFLMRQAREMFKLTDQVLTENPPVTGVPMVRKMTLCNLDALLHDKRYDWSQPFFDFVNSRLDKVIEELEKPVSEGMKIYKIYNHSFVARTGSVTIGFDLVRRVVNGTPIVSEEAIKRIADKCDVLFLTHAHSDHVDSKVVDMFLQAGKKVVATSNILASNEQIQHERAEIPIDIKVKLLNNRELKATILPGHQGNLINNIYVITTPEGYTVAHTGDQNSGPDLQWIPDIHKTIAQPDVLLVNCWTSNICDVVRGFNPKLVITGHENEMAHTVDHREAFWLTFQKLENISAPYVVMGWGEWYHHTN